MMWRAEVCPRWYPLPGIFAAVIFSNSIFLGLAQGDMSDMLDKSTNSKANEKLGTWRWNMRFSGRCLTNLIFYWFSFGFVTKPGFWCSSIYSNFHGKKYDQPRDIFVGTTFFFGTSLFLAVYAKLVGSVCLPLVAFFLQNMHLCTANSWGKAVRPCFSPWNLQELRWDAHVPCREILAMGPILLIDSRILTRSRHFFGVWIRETWKQPELEVVEYAKNVDIFRSTIALGSIAF